MDTDQALSIATIIALVSICSCGIAASCYRMRVPSQSGHLKVSRSDPDLTSILENSVPSASAKYIQPSLQDPEK